MTLTHAIDDGIEIAAVANKLLIKNGPGEAIRLIGVSCTNLTKEECSQLPVFPQQEGEKRNRLNQMVDRVTNRFGRGALRRASSEAATRAGFSIQLKPGDSD
jgi:DNA polymerase-4